MTFLPLRSAVLFGVMMAAVAVGIGVILLSMMLLYRGDLTGSMHGPTGERVLVGDDYWQFTVPILAALSFVLYFLCIVCVTLFGASLPGADSFTTLPGVV